MNVIFFRHASAEPDNPEGDEARRLTEVGRQEARTSAEALKVLGVELEVILTSTFRRALETAEIVAEVHRSARVEQFEPLCHPARPKKLIKRLGKLLDEGVRTVAAVGHAPTLDKCLARLASGEKDVGTSLSKAGAGCVVWRGEDAEKAPELRWLMRREQLAMLSEKALTEEGVERS